MKKHFLTALALFLFTTTLSADKQKVACVGDSITAGSGLSETYPMQLAKILGKDFEVKNFGHGGRTVLKKTSKGYADTTKFKQALAYNPDIVIIKLGTNDGKAAVSSKADFIKDYQEIISSFQKLKSSPKIILCFPIPAPGRKAIDTGVIPIIKEIAKGSNLPTFDLHTPLIGKKNLYKDRLHPNDEGAKLIAETVASLLKKID